MNKFKLLYISRDKHMLEIYVVAKNKQEALKYGDLKIKNLYYDNFNYQLKEVSTC